MRSSTLAHRILTLQRSAPARAAHRPAMGDHASGSSGARTSGAAEEVKASFALGLAGSGSGSGVAGGGAGFGGGGGMNISMGVGVPGLPPLVPPPSFLHPPGSASGSAAADYYYTACALGAAGLSTMAVLSGVNGSGTPRDHCCLTRRVD